MKSTFGKALTISLFGESHGKAIGVIIDGLAPGIKLDLDHIRHQLDLRKPQGKLSTARQEEDDFEIWSGFFQGYTTGSPLCLTIPNKSQESRDYEATKNLLRPAHADFTAFEKYQGFQDYRGGGHFSGRITAPLVAAGAICIQILKTKGIAIGSHIKRCGGIVDADFPTDEAVAVNTINRLNNLYFPAIDEEAGAAMQHKIEAAKEQRDSLGGIVETLVIGLPTGIGEPFFYSVESVLSHLLFSIPAVKGVEFGLGFGYADALGSQVNDSFYFDSEKEAIRTKSNNNGGLNGGITNGMPIVLRCAVKPTPSIYQPQNTVDYEKKADTVLEIKGRHDPAIIHRARVVVDSVVAIGLVDLFCERFGTTWQQG